MGWGVGGVAAGVMELLAKDSKISNYTNYSATLSQVLINTFIEIKSICNLEL